MALLDTSPSSYLNDNPTDMGWMARAACKGRTELFFAPRAERPQARARRERAARAICVTCSVSDVCRAFARIHHEYGFWGGESEDERHLAGFTISGPVGVRPQHDGARVVRPLMLRST